jgi:hypothetical protein
MTSGAEPRRQSRIGRLIVEFLVLFLAVSLSFVAEDIREDRAERREELVVLDAIRADLRGDLPIVNDILRFDSAAAWGAQWLHRNWERLELPPDSVTLALQAQYTGRVYAPVRAAYESAKGSGRFDFIDNPELRLAIGTHYETGQGERRAVNDLVIASLLEFNRALRPYVAFGADFPPVCCAPAVSLALPWSSVRGDRELRNTMLGSEMFRRLSAARMRTYEAAIRNLAAEITEEIEGRN